ncbi:MAG: hypothetical protein DWQ06_13490 [Calditrichaeota bacterium]|nr:MAG: hypothetical protein DWQ06_13490 [Calditrichota bacterium]
MQNLLNLICLICFSLLIFTNSHCKPKPLKKTELKTLESLPNQSFSFLVLGDSQNPVSKNPEVTNQPERVAIFNKIYEELNSRNPPDFVVHVGDFTETGSSSKEWKKYFDEIFWDKLSEEQKNKFFPVVGNHEYKDHFFNYGGYDLKKYYQHFPHIQKNRYYFFRYGNSIFIILDSGRNGIMKVIGGERWQNGIEEQIDWLKKEFFPHLSKQNEVENIFLIFHKPAYATPEYLRNKQSAKVIGMFEDYNSTQNDKFKLTVFNGHIHTFSHIVKDFNNDGKKPTDQFTIGTAGGKQRGKKYFKKIKTVEGLDLYRKSKYYQGIEEDGIDKEIFDKVRFDSEIFGYLEVKVGEEIEFIFHRLFTERDGFIRNYEFRK